ncbi:MAG: hypothetical protein IPJ19_16660 [Planctomycetes bacterium]|nr:hypothetical protein [Planctomycetota bacterium]
MKTTSLLRAVLLLLVVSSLGAWAWKNWRTPPVAAPASASVPDEGVVVINFHGALRCPTCLRIGALSKSVVDTEFALEASQGRVSWMAIDFEEPGNVHYREDYDLSSSNVVVLRRSAGRDLGWSRLDEVWSLNDDEPAFRAYVQAAVGEALRVR